MLHSSGLGRKAIMLPHQTRNVFLSWFLLHYITLGILAGNLCPPESLESVSLYPGMRNTFSLLKRRISLKCVQSSWLLECKEYCLHVFFVSGGLHVCTYLCTIIYTASLSECSPVCFHVYLSLLLRDVFFLCVHFVCFLVCVCVCAYVSVQQVFNKGKMFALLSTLTA